MTVSSALSRNSVCTTSSPENRPKNLILEECRNALIEDRCRAIVLGYGGMADLPAQLSHQLSIPVIDGVSAAVKFVEALVGLGLNTSKVGDLASNC